MNWWNVTKAYVASWIETWRIAPPFSKRRRDIIECLRDIENEEAWVEVDRPELDDRNDR